ncbi:MAG TPA: hypothetical protein VGP32_05550 [Steroidobacteraceae bacterium]|jgi:hypothetical protein|nr:hypothetical protein [Steroidobacteraceae bacterium]
MSDFTLFLPDCDRSLAAIRVGPGSLIWGTKGFQWREENALAIAACNLHVEHWGIDPCRYVEGRSYLSRTPQLSAVAQPDLGRHAGSLADQQRVIFTAIEFLIGGF